MATPPVHDVFVSYAAADRDWVEGYLLDALTAAGVRVHTEAAFALGQPRLSAFERGVTQSKRVLLVLSSAYLADDIAGFVDLLAQTHGLETGNRLVIPLRLEPVALPGRLGMLTGMDATTDEEQERAVARLLAEFRKPLPAPAPPPPCPYPGMRPYTETDAADFHGRERETQALLQRLYAQRERAHRILAVIGPSGSGKSSLVFAGLVPALRDSGLFGPAPWTVLTLRPGPTPMATPTRTSGRDATGNGPTLPQLLDAPREEHLLVIVDQFEELFTVADPAQVAPFQDVLARLAATPSCFVVLTARADFYEDLMGSPLWPLIDPNRVEVLPLGEAGLREAIVRPAARVGVHVEAALVERLVADAAGEPGVLPLVQETLVLLWERLERRYLPLRAYEALVERPGGDRRTGLQVAVARHADAVLAELPPERRAIARRVFLRLVQPNTGRSATRRQRALAELRAVGDEAAAFAAVVDHLAANRLLTLSGDEEDGSRRVDLAHEALIGGWDRLHGWLEADRDFRGWRERLAGGINQWAANQRENGALLRGAALAEAEAWLERRGGDLTRTEEEFIRRSLALREQEMTERARQRENAMALRSQVHAAAGAIGSGLAYGAAFGVAYWREVDADWWAAQVYGAAWFPLGVLFGLVVGIALRRARAPSSRRVAASVAVGSVAASAVYILARRWTATADYSFDPAQLAAGAATGAALALGVAAPLTRWPRLAATVLLGVAGLATAVSIDGWSWDPSTIILSGLLLGTLTAIGFLGVDVGADATPPAEPASRGPSPSWARWPRGARSRPAPNLSDAPSSASRAIALAGILLVTSCGGGGSSGTDAASADLIANRDEVFHQALEGARELLQEQEQRSVGEGDTVDVAGPGEGVLRFSDAFQVSLFRDSQLRLEAFVGEMSPVDRVRLTGGTLYAEGPGGAGEAVRRLEVTTGGAVITALGTEFLVHYNPSLQLTWVIVAEGAVSVAAGGVTRDVTARWQIWVERDAVLSPAFPATRAIADWAYGRQALPLLDDLGGPTLRDDAVLDNPQCTIDGSTGETVLLKSAPDRNAATLTAVPRGSLFEALFRKADGAWLRDIEGRWAPTNEMVCSYSVSELPVWTGPTETPTPPPTVVIIEPTATDTPATEPPTAEPTAAETVPPDTTPPPAPRIVSPSDGGYAPCAETVVLEWAPVSDESGIATYLWTIAADADGQYLVIVDGETTDTTVNAPADDLDCGAEYFWQVRATDNAGNAGDPSPLTGFWFGTTVD